MTEIIEVTGGSVRVGLDPERGLVQLTVCPDDDRLAQIMASLTPKQSEALRSYLKGAEDRLPLQHRGS